MHKQMQKLQMESWKIVERWRQQVDKVVKLGLLDKIVQLGLDDVIRLVAGATRHLV